MLTTPELRLAKLKLALKTLKRRIADQDESISYWQQRCAEIEVEAAEQNIKLLPKLARDRTSYTGDELTAALMTIQKEHDLKTELVEENRRLKYLLGLQNDPFKAHHPGLLTPTTNDDVRDYGTRFAVPLELGPTCAYGNHNQNAQSPFFKY